jgi:hypothetical protein
MPIFSGFSPFLGDIGPFWRPNSWRKLEVRNQLQGYINQACLRPREVSQSRVMLEKSQAKVNFDAEKLLRRRRCRIVSGSSGRPFCVSFSLQGSRDLGEQEHISIVAIWHCSNVLLSI